VSGTIRRPTVKDADEFADLLRAQHAAGADWAAIGRAALVSLGLDPDKCLYCRGTTSHPVHERDACNACDNEGRPLRPPRQSLP
jgi:hypothetical protein